MSSIEMNPVVVSRPSQRGFSLVELMAVVTITGILATLAVVGFSRNVSASRGAEAVSVIQAIRSAEETYKAENHVYLDVSSASGGGQWFPAGTPGKTNHNFIPATHVDLARWRALAPPVSQLVYFSYLANAGVPGTIMPTLDVTTHPDFSAARNNDWYVIQARGDTNGNSVFAKYCSTSMTGEIYMENEGE